MDTKKKKKKRVIIIILIAVLLPILGTIAYVEITFFLERPGSVTIISGGEEHEGITHYFFFWSDSVSNEGAPARPERFAQDLAPISLEDDFQIRVTGRPRHTSRYYFYRLDDDQWVSVLAVNPANHNEIFLNHGNNRRDEWEQVHAESFLDMLEPGEYIVEILVSWGTSRRGQEGQYVFRLTK